MIIAKGGEKTEIAFKRAVNATGGRPIEIPGFSIDGKIVIDSKGALALDEIPANMVVIGGGVIGMEMATFFAKFGCKVTVVELAEQILPGTDVEMVRVVERRLKKNNVEIFTGAKAKGWSKSAKGAEVEIETKTGSKKVFADKILLAVGVRPNSEGLGLDKAGVQIGEKGFVKTDNTLRTNVRHIYAIGDVAGAPMLAHKGSKEGLVAASIIAGHNVVYDVRAMPAAIFTDPEIATVGMSEEQATKAGHSIKVGKFPFVASGRALAIAQTDGFVKLVRDASTDRVLGVHIVGPNASDLIAEGTLAIEMGATAEDIALTVHTHPTLPEAVMEAAESSHGMAVHAVNRK
jgi:dihydrolipoamide dehydrogenase